MTSPNKRAVNGVWGAGLSMIGISYGNSGRNLMSDEVQRKVKGRDAEDGSDWETAGDTRHAGPCQA